MQITPKIMNILSSLSAEGVLRVCEVVSIIAGVLAVAALVGQVISGRIVNARQALRIEELRNENLALQINVSKRLFRNQRGAASRLSKFSGTKVVIIYSDIDEASSLARQIAYVLKTAGWEVLPRSSVLKGQTDFSGGVIVYGGGKTGAAPALTEELNKSDIRPTSVLPYPHPFRVTAALEGNLRDAVVVQVGPKPDIMEEKGMREMYERHKDPQYRGESLGNETDIPQ